MELALNCSIWENSKEFDAYPYLNPVILRTKELLLSKNLYSD